MKLSEVLLLNESDDLEQYRKQALVEIKSHAGEWKSVAERVLGKKVLKVAAIGSVVNKSKFTENSDIDVAFYLSNPVAKLNELASEKLQQTFVKMPHPLLGIINTLVFE